MNVSTLTTTVDKERLTEIARTILREPTAPFHEGGVRAAIAGLLGDCTGVSLRQDGFGNLIAHYRSPGGQAGGPVYAFCAHMDHPGWVRPAEESDESWRFLGGVPDDHLAANRDRIVPHGDFATWDLPDFEIDGDRLTARACDDLVGCAVIVAILESLAAANVPGECYGLFTRAEEVGFAGAVEMARHGWLQEVGATVISLETSAERPPAKMGGGPIVRVGDRISVFDAAVSAELAAAATAAGIAFQRCLMTGGACEATAFRLYGIRCGALCVALGNYHNIGPDRRIAAEYVSISDVAGLVRLGVELTHRGAAGTPDADAELLHRIEARVAPYQAYRHRDGRRSSRP